MVFAATQEHLAAPWNKPRRGGCALYDLRMDGPREYQQVPRFESPSFPARLGKVSTMSFSDTAY